MDLFTKKKGMALFFCLFVFMLLHLLVIFSLPIKCGKKKTDQRDKRSWNDGGGVQDQFAAH